MRLRTRYLKACADDETGDEDELMRSDLQRLMGEQKLRWWPMVDQLVFLEDDVGAGAGVTGSPVGLL